MILNCECLFLAVNARSSDVTALIVDKNYRTLKCATQQAMIVVVLPVATKNPNTATATQTF